MEYLINKMLSMIELENYKSNIDIIDKYSVKDIEIIQAVLYSGNTQVINEQLKPLKHDSPLHASAVIGLENTAIPLTDKDIYFDIWTDVDAQERFISTKPTCYLIVGKDGMGARPLGEEIAKLLNCIHLTPQDIILEEIEQNSPTGRTWDFNMRHNKPCTYEMLLKVLEAKMQSPAVQHRGYVLSDFPLVTSNSDPLYYFQSLYSEEAYLEVCDLLFDLIANLKKKPKKSPESPHSNKSFTYGEEAGEEHDAEEEDEDIVQEELEEEQVDEAPAQLPKFLLEPCSNIVFKKKAFYKAKQAALIEQIRALFSFSMKPDIIVQITCPDLDLVTKKTHKYLNYHSGEYQFEPFYRRPDPNIRWPSETVQINTHWHDKADHTDYDFDYKYNCRPPINFPDRSVPQICNYRKYVYPYLKEKLKDYDPNTVIEIDGRTKVLQMKHHVEERIRLMRVQPVIIPEPMYLEEIPEELSEFWSIVSETNAITHGGLTFGYYSSQFGNRCPVELQRRRSVVGNPRYAVRFFKHVYLMASLENFVLFCRNPRPYLKLENLEPTCRIIITGTKSAGKSMIAECLSWIFHAPIIDYKAFVETLRQNKHETYKQSVLSELIASIEDTRYQKWQKEEEDRASQLESWCNSALIKLNEYLPYLVKCKTHESNLLLKVQTEDGDHNHEDKDYTSEDTDDSLDSAFKNEFNDLKNQLSFLPVLESVEECEKIIESQEISKYAPIELLSEIKKPSIPVLGDDDVEQAISEYIELHNLQNEMEPTVEEIMPDFINNLTAIDTKHQEETNFQQLYGKYIIDGFPSDSTNWDYFKDPKLLPDYTIAVIENKEIDQDLFQKYLNIPKYTKNYEETILASTDPLIVTRLNQTKPSDLKESDINILSNYLINKALDFIFITSQSKYEPESSADIEENSLSEFSEAIDKFREDWDSIKLKLEEKFKVYIETELDNKTGVEIINEVLLKVRQGYFSKGEIYEEEQVLDEEDDNDDETPKDLLTYNDTKFYCETSVYCPIAYRDYGILWRGKPEFCLKLSNKVHMFSKEDFLEKFNANMNLYQSLNQPFKKMPTLKICIIGSLGCGATTLAKSLAKELGILHINFQDVVNNYMMPRHFKNVGRNYENLFTDEALDDEAVVDFQMDEENDNLVSDVLSNETEMRRMLNNYLERGTPMLPALMQKLITKIWFDPFVPTGFVLDGYPRIANDVEDMFACFCIPDIVIELESSSEVALQRLGPQMFQKWKSQQNDAKQIAKNKLNILKKEWMRNITKQIVVNLIIKEVLENMPILEEAGNKISTESVIVDSHPSGSTNVDPALFSAYNEMIEQSPEPVDTSEWEKADDARERIDTRIESIFEMDDENIQSLKDSLMDQKIKILTIDGTKSRDKVFRLALSKLDKLKNRETSFFEQTFILNVEVAESLLARGFYFYSKFNRLCPVHLHENPETILNIYTVLRRKEQIFPVAHRPFIYFISGAENVIKFRSNPLKYIISDAVKKYFEYPIKIGVIGTPKVGQTTLATKLAKQNGLLYVSSGTAVRNILEDFHWTQLAAKLHTYLKNGKRVDDDLIVKAVQTLILNDHRTFTHGFVMDGLPVTPYEAKGLVKNGLFPNIVFDIIADKEKIVGNSQNQIHYDILKHKPPFPPNLMELRYLIWTKKRYSIKSWLENEYQNVHNIDGNSSKWQILHDATTLLVELCAKIHYYVSNVDDNIVRAMLISSESFEERQTKYKNMCPVCFHKFVYRHSEYPVDKKGIVQYKNKFYWICPEHIDTVMLFPHLYLLDDTNVEIPELPVPVKYVKYDSVYENGICIVTYAESLPAQVFKLGSSDYAARFGNKSYLFCSQECLSKFLAKPHLYHDISVFKASKKFPKINLKELPNLGYLEQTLANVLTKACCLVNVIRPKYPGLSFPLSAVIYIALYLKIHNPLLDKEQVAIYHKALKVFEARSKLILKVGLLLRSMENPFASYPQCRHPQPTMRPGEDDLEPLCSAHLRRPTFSSRSSNYVQMHKSSLIHPLQRTSALAARRVPVPDERFDYLCEFHKPVSKVPAFLNVVDIAGLVRGAAEGQGLGNAFLSHIKACDAIFNLCRAFDDEDVIHVDGDVNPIRDLETIGEELRLKDEEQLMQNFEKLDRVVNRGGDKKLKPEYDALTRIKTVLVDEKKHIRFGDWSAADIEVLNKYLFLTSKPALYLVNLSEKDYIRKKNKWLPKLKEWIDKNDPGAPLIPFSGALETKLIEMEPEERQAFLKEHNITSALDKIIVQGYKALQLEYFFTAGPDEVKAWTIQKGTKAPQAAGRIHTDFEKGFIMAEVMHYKDFKEEGTEAACKAAGKYRQQGRNYVVEDGDIIFFKFNAGAGLKDAKKK